METGRAFKLFRTGVGKLFLIAAGCGALVLVMFVLMPMLTPTQEPEQPSTPQDIVAEVMGESLKTGERETSEQPAVDAREDLAAPQDMEEGGVMPEPAPLLALPTADTLPVVFPREEPETAEDPAEADEAEAAGDGLPPLLTPEEIEAALPEPAPPTDPTRAVDSPAAKEILEGPAPEMVVQVAAATGDTGRQIPGDALPAQALAAMPLAPPVGAPPAAVREVQALLTELGYAPGPVDGVWGVRTKEAWQAFARDTERLARGTVLESAGERPILETPLDEGSSEEPTGLGVLAAAVLAAAALESRSPSEAASPSEALSLQAASGNVQAGNAPPGLPRQPVTLPGTLRGVMGYRMPLISRQEVPDQVVSGVLIPAHTTFVILKPGYWELTGLTPDDVELLRDAETRAEAEALAAKPEPEPQPVKRGWNPLRLFRKGKPAASTP